ncbi:MAG: integrase core domain-containing protein [Candidatus Aenigmatarchaeota archaeon]
MDFTFTKLTNKKLVKILAIEDVFSRKSLVIYHNFSIIADRVIEVLSEAIRIYGRAIVIRSDNGPEFISELLESFCIRERIIQEFIPSGKPYYNGGIERFIGSLKVECLNCCSFDTIEELGEAIERYQVFYNAERPHQSLGYLTPDEVYYANKREGKLKIK